MPSFPSRVKKCRPRWEWLLQPPADPFDDTWISQCLAGAELVFERTVRPEDSAK